MMKAVCYCCLIVLVDDCFVSFTCLCSFELKLLLFDGNDDKYDNGDTGGANLKC